MRAQSDHPRAIARALATLVVVGFGALASSASAAVTWQNNITGSGAQALLSPEGVAMAGSNIVVADAGSNRLETFTPGGAVQSTLAAGTVAGPRQAVLVGGDFITADTNHNRVEKINAGTGTDDGSFGTLPSGASWSIIRGVATNADQSRVAVASAGTGTVYVFDSSGGVVRALHATPGTSAATLSYPEGEGFDAAGNVWVADTQNHRVVEFSGTDGSVLKSWANSGSPFYPTAIAVDQQTGNLWVADWQYGRVLEFDSSGGLLTTLTNANGAADPLQAPLTVALDAATGDLYVTDERANRIVRYSGAGAGVGAGTPPANTAVPTGYGSNQPIVGEQFSGSAGSWSGTQPISYAYTWLRCPDTTISHCAIASQSSASASTTTSYTLHQADVGDRMLLQVTATNSAGSATAYTASFSGVIEPRPSVTIFQPTDGTTWPLAGFQQRFRGLAGRLGGDNPTVTLTIFRVLSGGATLQVLKLSTQASGETPDGAQAKWTIDLVGDNRLSPGSYLAVAQQSNDSGNVSQAQVRWAISGPSNGGSYDVQGVEVNQGTQFYRLDQPGADGVAHYTGVPLAAAGQTVVRMFVAATQPVVASLTGYRGGRSLGTLTPTNGGPDLSPSTGGTLKESRSAGGYVFDLPPSWTQGKISLVGSVRPTSTVVDSGGACGDCRLFELSGVSFWSTSPITFRFVRLQDPSGNWPDPAKTLRYFGIASNLIPEGVGQIALDQSSSEPFWGWIRPSSADQALEPKDRYLAIQSELRQFASNYTSGEYTVGVSNDLAVGATGGSAGPFHPPGQGGPISTVSISDGPLTDMTHEFFHGFGQPHSQTVTDNPACYTLLAHVPAGAGVDLTSRAIDTTIPPGGNPTGLFNGVGLNRMTPSGDGTYPAVGFAVRPFYDLMSYCAEHNDFGDLPWLMQTHPGSVQWPGAAASISHAWLDPVEWAQVFPRFSPAYATAHGLAADRSVRGRVSADGRPSNGRAAATIAASGPALNVEAFDDGGQVHITSVTPATGPAPIVGATPSYVVVGKLANGSEIRAPMTTSRVESHETNAVAVLLSARIPAAGLTSLTITRDGVNVATRARSAHPPTVMITSPARGAHVGRGRTVRIAWRAADADRGPLNVAVAYSYDGGASWHPIFTGPSVGHVEMPSGFFSRSTAARVRVAVNDGFNTTTAISAPFVAAGTPPAPAIVQPLAGKRAAVGQPLALAGRAIDDRGRLIASGRLRWYLAGRLVGRGRSLTITPTRAGRQTLRLIATDRSGRTGAVAVRIRVRPPTPVLTMLRQLGSVGPRSKRLVLLLTANQAVVLTVGHHRYTVGTRPRRVRIAVAPGAGQLKLTFHLRGGGRSAVERYAVQR